MFRGKNANKSAKMLEKATKIPRKRQKTPKIIPEITIERKMNEKSSHDVTDDDADKKAKMRKQTRLCKVSFVMKLLILLMIFRVSENANADFNETL